MVLEFCPSRPSSAENFCPQRLCNMKLKPDWVHGNRLSGSWWGVCCGLHPTHPTGLTGSHLSDICLMTIVYTVSRQLSARAELVGLEFKATNFLVVGKQSAAASPMPDVADFSLVGKHCYEA
ncbi:hypothetical protein Acr_14g0002140 [Actinidia rufa]|uniref:Uncharacterized protein n=1 Tax=Actinidia rufa TaxID=165716 RepID=A0A7J0FPD8_9ERIC|nr:hypothetical protein Acr_14g0002140 [Actinidia rufa]